MPQPRPQRAPGDVVVTAKNVEELTRANEIHAKRAFEAADYPTAIKMRRDPRRETRDSKDCGNEATPRGDSDPVPWRRNTY